MPMLNWLQSADGRGEPTSPQGCFTRVSCGSRDYPLRMVNLNLWSRETRVQFIEKYDEIVRSWPVPVEERDVTTSFGTTHDRVSGPESAPPLALLHGAAVSPTTNCAGSAHLPPCCSASEMSSTPTGRQPHLRARRG